MSDFEAILSRKVEDTTQPPVFPAGTYRLAAVGAKGKEGRNDNSDYVSFVYRPVEPMEDVDADRFAEIDEEDFEGARLFSRIWLGDKRDEWNLRKHLEKHGIDMTGRTYDEVLKDIAGAEVMGYVTEDVAQDGETPINNIQSFSAV